MKFASIFAIGLTTVPVGTFAAACTPAQLNNAGGVGFRFTGGGGTYFAGTNQVVSFDRPNGSPVSAVNGITVVPSGANTPVFNPTGVSGIPVAFASNAPDTAGSIGLTLPTNLPAGAFAFRLALTSTGGTCTLDQIFTSLGSQTVNQCAIGDSKCLSTSTFANCVTSPNGNVFGTSQTCGAGTSCVQTGNKAICTSGGPITCGTPGQYSCSGTGFRICGANGQFTAVLPCQPGTHCITTASGVACALNTAPVDECSAGRCISPSTFQACITGPLGNKVFGPTQTCGAGTSCTGAGFCTSSVPVQCTSGTMRCIGATTFETCVNGTFGFARNCAGGTTCAANGDFIVCK